jgi:hypothetical protein
MKAPNVPPKTPTHAEVLEESLQSAGELPELAPLVEFLHRAPSGRRGGGSRRAQTARV